MAVLFRSLNAQLAAVVQGAAGTEGAPNAATDAVRVYGDNPIGWSADFNRIDTNYTNASISDSAPSISAGKGQMKIGAYLTGSTTAGAAADPDYGKLILGCGTQEVKTAADKSGTAQAGAVGTITLQVSGSSAVDDAYKGMVIETTGGTGSGQRRVIFGYIGSTKVATVTPKWSTTPDATTTYAIRKNTLWSPITTGQSLLTLWGYQHASPAATNSRRRRLFDAMGSCVIAGKPRDLVTAQFTFSGRISGAPDDVAKPSAPTALGGDPQPVQGANCYLGRVGSAAATKIKFTDFSIDFGNQVGGFDDPSDANGYDSFEITRRNTTGSITLNLQDIATRDNYSDAAAMTEQPLWISWGAVGNGFSILIPRTRITNPAPDNGNGWQVEKVEFDAAGTDTEFYMCAF